MNRPWHRQDILEVARLCAAVYDDPADTAKRLGFSGVRMLGRGGPTVAVISDANRMIVCVRGTETHDAADVLADIRVGPMRSFFGGVCHRGFHEYADMTWPQIETAILESSPTHLVFAGHSLGGAMACHFAGRAGLLRKSQSLSLPHLVTFGAPLVGSPAFCRGIAIRCSSVTRVTNRVDPVPLIPLWPLYRHVPARRIHMRKDGSVAVRARWTRRLWQRLCRLPWEWWKQWSFIRGVFAAVGVQDHSMERYVEGLEDAEL